MEKQVVIDPADNGREVDADDINNMGEAGAIADDRVLAEIFRLLPFDGSTVARGVIPYAVEGAGTNLPIITPGVAAREVFLEPMRCVIGSRTAEATDAKASWRDVRSCLSMASTTRKRSVVLAANSDGNPRWDLIYVTITPDAEESDTRYIKDPTSKDVSSATFVVNKETTFEVNVEQGTSGGTPTRPTLPADGAGSYNIPIAYVSVDDGAMAILDRDIQEVAPVLNLSRATGGMSARPANQSSANGGTVLTNLPWDATQARPAPVLFPSMVGAELLWIPIQLKNGVDPSHLTNDIIDDSRDWRKRIFMWWAFAHATDKLATDPDIGTGLGVPGYAAALGDNLAWGMGHSMSTGGETDARIINVSSAELSVLSADLRVYVKTSNGKLYVSYSAPVEANIWIALLASAPLNNR